jgi:hypothetical protein
MLRSLKKNQNPNPMIKLEEILRILAVDFWISNNMSVSI